MALNSSGAYASATQGNSGGAGASKHLRTGTRSPGVSATAFGPNFSSRRLASSPAKVKTLGGVGCWPVRTKSPDPRTAASSRLSNPWTEIGSTGLIRAMGCATSKNVKESQGGEYQLTAIGSDGSKITAPAKLGVEKEVITHVYVSPAPLLRLVPRARRAFRCHRSPNHMREA